MILASSPYTNGAAEVPWWDFAGGQPVRIEGYLSDLPAGEVMERAQELVGRLPYHPTNANCEHYVTHSLGYEAHSRQLQEWVKLGALAIGVYLLAMVA